MAFYLLTTLFRVYFLTFLGFSVLIYKMDILIEPALECYYDLAINKASGIDVLQKFYYLKNYDLNIN
jgi:hypothetical protein